MSDIGDWTQDIHAGDAADTLAEMPESSVHMCMTSPPYYGLRDYGEEGQLGLEDTLDEYIDRLVAVGDALRRVLRPDGSWWLNLGDSYAGSWGAQSHDAEENHEAIDCPDKNPARTGEMQRKNKMLVPHRVAIALQQSGWVVRNDVTWCLAATTKVYARTQKRTGPMMVKDIARLDPSTVKLWNGNQWTQAANFFKNPSPDETVRLQLRNGQRIDCTTDHRWPTDNGLKQAGDLSEGDVLRETALPEPDDCRQPAHLPDRDTGWFVGMYLAEGARGKGGDQIQIASHTNETERFERLQDIAAAYDGHCQMHETGGNAASINLHGDVLTGIIDRYIGGHTAGSKRLLPRCWMRSDGFLDALLRGYLAGDGHHDTANNRWRLGFTRNDRLADDLRTLCARLGYQVRLQRDDVDGHKIYRGEVRFEKSRSCNTRSDAEIVAIGSSPCRTFYDIEVADDPHLFALASGVLTHNCKPNPMPSSVTDRLNTTTEQVFHLTPNPDYWYDLDAVREPYSEYSQRMSHRQESGVDRGDFTPHAGIGNPDNTRADMMHPAGKNPGDVFEVTTKPYPEAHFAVYPPELCETPIKTSCPPQVCVECGAPYIRESVNTDVLSNPTGREQKARAIELYDQSDLDRKHLSALRSIGVTDAGQAQEVYDGHGRNRDTVERRAERAKDVLGGYAREFLGRETESTEWVQGCDCATDETQPGIVLDPFAGAGTTCLVAKRLGRRFVGIDLNPEYVALAQRRVGVTVDDPERLLDDDATALRRFADGADGGDAP